MKSIRQLLRQPVKTAAGIVIIALAVAIFVTCAGQYLAAGLTRDELEYKYETVALTTQRYKRSGGGYSSLLPDEYSNWIQETAEAHPELVKTISDTGLLSAYIPELVLDNYTQHFNAAEGLNGSYNGIYGMPYSCAVLEVVLTEISPDVKKTIRTAVDFEGNRYELQTAVTLTCKGTVERAVQLQEGYNDPTGYSVELTVKAYDEAALAALDLEVGGRYLVYGMDYFDRDWFLRSIVSADQANFSQPIDASKVHTQKPEGYPITFYKFTGTGNVRYYENIVNDDKTYIEVFESNLADAQSCRLTVCDYSALPEFIMLFDEYNTPMGAELWFDRRLLLEDEHSDTFTQSGTTVVPAEEYIAAYGVPTVARLDGTAEEFLASEAGAAWKKAMEAAEIDHHAFPVLAVDKLGYQAEFARGQADIVEGRDFSQAELDAGEQVCILSQSLAELNGLTLGDTITLQSYAYDPNVNREVGVYPELGGLGDSFYVEPGFYSSARGFTGEPKTYTVVGLYSRENAWQDNSFYAFTPNTIFIPKASADDCMVTSTEGVFRSYVLENGAVDAFDALVKEAGYSGLFVYYDHGYSQVKDGLDAYESVSGRALYVGAGAFLGVMLLYILLFPLRQRRHLAAMSVLGANRVHRLAHLMTYNLGMLLPGVVLGTLVGALVWRVVTGELMASVDVSVSLSLDPWMIPMIGALLFLFMAVVLLISALLQIREGRYMRRKD